MSSDSPSLQDITGDLDRLALAAVMLAEDDLPALGAFLTDLARLQDKVAGDRDREVLSLLNHMAEVANRLALDEIKAATQALELINLGISLLQQRVRRGSWPESGEEFGTFCRLARELGVSEPGQKDASDEDAVSSFLFDDPELLANFLTEAHEHLDGIETHLVHLEQHPDELEAVNAIFRPFHTIKGVAGFLNLTQIQDVGHEVESLLDKVRSSQIPVSQDLIDAVLVGVDLLKEMLADIEGALSDQRGLHEFDTGPLNERINALSSSPAKRPRLGEILVGQGILQPEELAKSLEIQRTSEHPRPLGEILIEEGKVSPEKVAQALVQQLSDSRPAKDVTAPATVKVDPDKVDTLVDLMGELVIIQSQVRQNRHVVRATDQKLVRDLVQMARITSDLQRISMSLRMVPIGATFRKMVRLVRDLSHKVAKRVALHLEGEDTEIDRNMVEAIYDPLVHLVRNAVDHGLETPNERQALGKPAEGQLWLRAFHKGGSILIEIEDDGRGLDRQAILARARERGLMASGEPLSPVQIDNLIFEPGFSTAPEVTEVSGRGVGLDVVKQSIESLRGKVEINSRPQAGSRFTLRLPLTLAIIDALVIRVGEERYILPAVGVRETVHPGADDYFTVTGKGELIRVRNHLIPLLRLHRLFRVGDPEMNPTQALALVVEHEGSQQALLVDEILGKQEVVIKSLGAAFQQLNGVAGGTILGDGRVGLILDLAGLFQMEQAGPLCTISNFQEK